MGQSYVLPVLPFGFALAPPLACANTELLAAVIEQEALARWRGDPGSPGLSSVATHSPVGRGVPPLSTVYVDDYMNSADASWIKELVEIAEKVFEAVGVIEKKAKRKGPGTAMPLLGFHFDASTGRLSVQEAKKAELVLLLDRALARARDRQSSSVRCRAS